jgi:hypothetical protein
LGDMNNDSIGSDINANPKPVSPITVLATSTMSAAISRTPVSSIGL